MPQCEGTTRDGARCKKSCSMGSRCHMHTGDACPVCMVNMTEGASRTLDCGHVFHKTCLERWKIRSSTCPMCRAPFDQPMYRVKLTIDPMGYENELTTSNIQNLVDMFGLDTTSVERFISTISFAVMNTNDLRNILSEVGFPSIIPPGVDFPSLYTEG